MNYDVIATGSTGNAVIVGNLLIDCGVSHRKLLPYIEDEVGRAKIKFVLLTHAHRDHFLPSTAKLISDRTPSVGFVCCPWMVGELIEACIPKRKIHVLKPNTAYFFGEHGALKITPILLKHDVPNCGYKLHFRRDGGFWRCFYATDCANLNGIEANGYDLYMIEANHREAEIAERIREKEEAGVFCYERRAAEVHLSREQAERFIADNAWKNSRYVYLHQHKEEK